MQATKALHQRDQGLRRRVGQRAHLRAHGLGKVGQHTSKPAYVPMTFATLPSSSPRYPLACSHQPGSELMSSVSA